MSSDKVEINSGDSLADQLSRTEYLSGTEQSIGAASPYIALKEKRNLQSDIGRADRKHSVRGGKAERARKTDISERDAVDGRVSLP